MGLVIRLISTLLNHLLILVSKSNLARLRPTKLSLVQSIKTDFEILAQVNNKSQLLYLLLIAKSEMTPHFWF